VHRSTRTHETVLFDAERVVQSPVRDRSDERRGERCWT
jgi:hypothetical protein